MKKRNEWVRKELKRKLKKADKGIVDFIKIQQHYFPELSKWFNDMKDARNESYVTYPQSDLACMGLLKNVCGVKSMNSMNEMFNEEACIDTLGIISGDMTLHEMPHSDTLNYYLEKQDPDEFSEIRKKMIKKLIRDKTFHRGRLLGKYWRVIIDGTGLFCFKEKHCEHCLVTVTEKEDGTKEKRYFHKVLEAKIAFSDKIVMSIGTEFIENESEDVSKNDCELNAAKRLFGRLKKEYPKLPVCIQGDALYAAGTVMELCRENGWHYILTQKDTRQRALAESYGYIESGGGLEEVTGIGKEKGTGRFANGVEETAGKDFTANMFDYRYETKDEGGHTETHMFRWITDIELTKRNLTEMINAGRGRWKIENEGFNSQKNGIYDIEHLNSRNSTAMKNHYLLTQIADILMQLYLNWTPLTKKVGQSIKNTSSRLLESFRQCTITDEDVSYIQRYTTVYLE